MKRIISILCVVTMMGSAQVYENSTATIGRFTAANRARPLLNAQLVFQPVVFSGEDDGNEEGAVQKRTLS